MLLMIGFLQFKVNAPAFEEKAQSYKFNWAKQGRLMRRDASQYTGRGTDTMTIDATWFDELVKNPRQQIAKVVLTAAVGVPYPIIDGAGWFYGLWVIDEVDVKESHIRKNGRGAQAKVSLKLSYYGPDLGGYL